MDSKLSVKNATKRATVALDPEQINVCSVAIYTSCLAISACVTARMGSSRTDSKQHVQSATHDALHV